MRPFRGSPTVVLLLVLAVLLTARDIGWTAPIADSSAFGESVSLVFLPNSSSGLSVPVRLDSGPLPTAAGTAPPAYNVTNSLPAVTVGTALQTGLVTVNAASMLPTSLQVLAGASLDNVAVNIAPLLTLAAMQIKSTATIDSALNAIGTVTIANGTSSSNVSLPSNPAPNTVLIDTGGIKVVLNEQTITGNGLTARDISMNAVDVTFTNVPFGSSTGNGLLSGKIILSHSEAHAQGAVAAVPEPASLMLLGTGLALVRLWVGTSRNDNRREAEGRATSSRHDIN